MDDYDEAVYLEGDVHVTLEASREPAAMVRDQARSMTGIEFLDVAEFELVLGISLLGPARMRLHKPLPRCLWMQ